MTESIINILNGVYASLPDKTAIVHADREYAYSELWNEILACSAVLSQMGITKGSRIALLLNNSFQYVVAYYGVLHFGGVVVALNVGANKSDIHNWIQHSGARVIIAESDLLKSSNYIPDANSSIALISLESGNDTTDGNYWRKRQVGIANHSTSVDLANNDLASIIYTSGTTGKPKGVTLTHGNLYANFNEVIRYLKLTSKDSIVSILPFFYSYGNSIMHTHLMTGATLYIENSFMYPAKIMQRMSESRVTGFSGVPATYSILLSRTNLEDYDLSSLRYITQAGGAMPPSNIQKIQKHLPNTDIYIMYGQTEATARISYLEPSMLTSKLGSVGKPLHGISLEIRDEDNKVLGAGVEGEIYVSGLNIMHGYWGDANLTSTVLRDGYLKTGDIGYLDKDGYIFLTGRLSDMIKVGGNRISPLEIEEVVSRLEGIEEVAASGVDDEMLGQVVKITVVKSPGSNITEMQIKAFCRQQLALYKIPKFIEFVEYLPKTSSGKVKRYML